MCPYNPTALIGASLSWQSHLTWSGGRKQKQELLLPSLQLSRHLVSSWEGWREAGAEAEAVGQVEGWGGFLTPIPPMAQ